MTRRLVDVAQDSIITEDDCETIDGIDMTPLVEGGEIIESLGDRVLGAWRSRRSSTRSTADPCQRRDRRGEVELIENASVDHVKIRSVLTCQSRNGVCSRCYGRDLARGQMVNIGEAIGVIAAQSIGEPGTQLTMRTFHIGGTASRHVEQTELDTRNAGVVRFHSINAVANKDGDLVVMSRNGQMTIVEESAQSGRERERERYPIVYGAKLKVKDGQSVKAGARLAEWDPYTTPILTEVSGVR